METREILSKAVQYVTDESGKPIDPATVPVERQTDAMWLSWMLVSAHAGIDKLSSMLTALGIGDPAGRGGELAERVRILGEQRDRLRSLADVGAREIQRLTTQRDAARAGIAVMLDAIQAGDIEVSHEPTVQIRGRDHEHTTACPMDDTCQCKGRVAVLKAQLAQIAGDDVARAATIIDRLSRAGAWPMVQVQSVEVKAEDPDRWIDGMTDAFLHAKQGPSSALGAADALDSRIAPADTVIIVEALDLWDRYLTAPHADIARIRAMLVGPPPGAPPEVVS